MSGLNMPEIFRNRQGTGAPPRSGEAPSGGETSVLFHKDGDQGHAFNQGRQRDGNHHNGGGSSGVASGGFRGFRANEANAEAAPMVTRPKPTLPDSSAREVIAIGSIMLLVWFMFLLNVPPQVAHGPERKAGGTVYEVFPGGRRSGTGSSFSSFLEAWPWALSSPT